MTTTKEKGYFVWSKLVVLYELDLITFVLSRFIYELDPRIKISVIGFYENIENIGKISVNIFTKISVRLKFFVF